METTTPPKWRQTDALPSSGQLRLILLWLAKRHLESGLGYTARIRRPDIAAALAIPLKSIAKQLTRLIDGGYVERLDTRHGRGDAGAVFCVHNAAKIVTLLENDPLKWRQESESNGDNKWRQQPELPHVVSSIYTTTTTTPQELSADHLKELIDRFRLDVDFNVGVNELKAAFKSAGLTPDAFAESVEHLSFYLRSPEAEGIRHARAWFVKTLREGYYDEPVGFVSWEDQQLAKQLLAAKAKRDRAIKLKKELFEAAYDTWFAEQTPEQLAKLTRGTPFEGRSRATLKGCLRGKFAEISGHDMPEELEG